MSKPNLLHILLFKSHWAVSFSLTLITYLLLTFWLPTLHFASPAGAMLQRAILTHRREILIGMGSISLLALSIGLLTDWRKHRLFTHTTSLARINTLSWKEFETLLSEAYKRHGYRVTHNPTPGPDGGIDLRLTKDQQHTLVQCKHWKTTRVGVRTVRELYGVLLHEHASHAILICSGSFTKEAEAFALNKPLTLLDGSALLRLLGLDQEQVLPDTPPDERATLPTPSCPLCKSPMRDRLSTHGRSPGQPFYGCSRYPLCKGTRTKRSTP